MNSKLLNAMVTSTLLFSQLAVAQSKTLEEKVKLLTCKGGRGINDGDIVPDTVTRWSRASGGFSYQPSQSQLDDLSGRMAKMLNTKIESATTINVTGMYSTLVYVGGNSVRGQENTYDALITFQVSNNHESFTWHARVQPIVENDPETRARVTIWYLTKPGFFDNRVAATDRVPGIGICGTSEDRFNEFDIRNKIDTPDAYAPVQVMPSTPKATPVLDRPGKAPVGLYRPSDIKKFNEDGWKTMEREVDRRRKSRP